MKILYSILLSLLAIAAAASAAKPLRIYFIDVEGGQATLFVAPSGQSLLIDTGWGDYGNRDADRIAAAAKDAGVSTLNYMVITHYHDDHVGGVPQLAAKMKIETFIDHGPNREDSDDTRNNYAAYEKAAQGAKRLTVEPGDRIPVEGLDVEVLSADGQTIASPLAGAGQANPLCATEPVPAEDLSENQRSAGVLITYGKLRVLDLGDLTKKRELQLACPKNLIGRVDLFVVTHHGSTDSNARALVDALHARVAIMDNGARKGASPDAWQTVHDAPGLQDLWQIHYAMANGKQRNVGADFIANLDENCQGKSITVVAEPDGTMTVTNTRTGFNKTYEK